MVMDMAFGLTNLVNGQPFSRVALTPSYGTSRHIQFSGLKEGRGARDRYLERSRHAPHYPSYFIGEVAYLSPYIRK